jgi:hypothetical protein
MVPIEQVQVGMLIFLECGCSATRWMTHPTGAATLIVMHSTCDAHRDEKIEARALSRGTLVSPLVRPIAQTA